MPISYKVLVVEDEYATRKTLVGIIKELKAEVFEAQDGIVALQIIKEQQPHLILSDWKMERMDGLELLKETKLINTNALFIMITAYGNIQHAVEVIKEGAYDYIEKPFSKEVIIQRVKKAIENIKLKTEVSTLKNLLGKEEIIYGTNSPMKAILAECDKIAYFSATVLIEGKNGTGKELIARYLHKNSSVKNGPFIPVNCAAIPKELIESELFGHEKGAFTGAIVKRIGKFELAHGGTIFLDEIGDMYLDVQAKILRVIENKEFQRVGGKENIKVNVRIIAATNKDLKQEIINNTFREDLFHRLNILPIILPSLMNRKEDIPLLCDYFIKKFSALNNKKILSINKEAMTTLLQYHYSGNVRELKNFIERAVLLCAGDEISLNHLPQSLQGAEKASNEYFVSSEGNNWVELWKMQLQENKGKFLSDDIIKTYPSFTKGKLELITYPGTSYAGYGVLMHLAISFGSWTKLGEFLKNNEEPRAKITNAANNLLEELCKDKNHFKVCFLFGNRGYKQVTSAKPVSFDVTVDYNIDFILIDTKEKKILAPKNNSLREELMDITGDIDESIKTIIYEATKTKVGRSAASSKDKSTGKK